MADLIQSTCEPCRGGIPPLEDPAIQSLLREVPGWRVVEKDGVKRLEREFRFDTFRAALAFAVQVGCLAEREDHHPDLHVGWGRVVVEIWTHSIDGLHRNDFILAAKVSTIESKPRSS